MPDGIDALLALASAPRDRLTRSEANMADMLFVLEEVKRRIVEVGENGPKPAQRL